MTERRFEDPVLELSMRMSGDDPTAILDMADTTAEEAQTVLEVLDEVEAEERAAGILASMRRQGHAL